MEDHDLLEFEKLKDEQIGRLTYRDTLFYFTMTIIGGALAIACSDKDKQASEILLALPFAVFIGGVAHITCDRRIDDIGTYVHERLSVAVAKKIGAPPSQVFAWEEYFRAAPLHWWRKTLQFISNLMLYSASGATILLFYLLRNNKHTFAELPNTDRLFWLIGMALMIAMFVLITVFTFFKFKWTVRIQDEPVSPRFRGVLRFLIGGAIGALVSAAILVGAPLMDGRLAEWLRATNWQIQPLYVFSAIVGLIAWRLAVIVGRH